MVKDYMIIENSTGNILYTMSWGRNGIPDNFTVPEGKKIEELKEEFKEELVSKLSARTRLKIKNINGITFAEAFEEFIIPPKQKQPSEADYLVDLDFRVSMIELGI
jgi:hypothetical protein